jgi:hypothetical protein
MSISKGFSNARSWSFLLVGLIIEIIYLYGFFTGLKIIIPWLVFSFFLVDVQIAIAHFEIDNFKPDDNGYKHHLVIAKYGFKYEKLLNHSGSSAELVEDECAPGCRPCAPDCRPCTPCSPSKKSSCDPVEKTTYNYNLLKHSILACLIQLLCYYLKLNVGLGLMIPIFYMLNSISGSGAPDYYAHHVEKAPKYVRLMQDYGLLMTPNQHEEHHKNPKLGYAYFSPVTNMILDKTSFWTLITPIMEWKHNMKSVPVPVPLANNE